MSLACYQEVKVCLSYVTKRSKYVSRMLPRGQSMSLVCYQDVKVCLSYVTKVYDVMET